jgi:phage I-like protein
MATEVLGEPPLIRIVSATVSLVGEDGEGRASLPEEIQLVPWDWVRSTNGDFLLDAEAAEAVLREFQRHGTDLVIDYEHQSLGGRYAAPNGLAPAAGWITALEIRPGDGIWGRVRWTPAAARRVLRREYRFLSPVVIIRKDDRKVMSLDSVALTNRPAIAGMRPVVNRRDEELRVQDAEAEPARQRQAQAKEDVMQDEIKQLRQLLSLDEQAEGTEVVRQACSRLADLLEQARQREATERVACAMQTGKVCEAQKDWATRYALRDPAGFEEWVKDAPVLVPLQRIAPQAGETADSQRSGRRTVIAAARGEYKANVLLQQLTAERAYVDEALEQAGLQRLAEQETL